MSLLAIAAAALVLAACQPSARPAAPDSAPQSAAPASGASAQSPPTEVQRLLTAAQGAGETELNVSWGNSLGGADGVKKLEAVFNRLYGTSIRVNFTPGPSMADMAAKVAQELVAGRQASTDLVIGTPVTYSALLNGDVFEPYDYTKLSPRVVREVVAPRNVGVEVRTSVPVIAYNTDLVPPAEAPRTLEEVLNPRWKGRIASAPDIPFFDAVAYRPGWDAERLMAYITRLSEHLGGLIRVSESSRVASGEFVMLVLASSDAARLLRAQGAPLGVIVPEDAAQVILDYLGVPRNSAHPNLAKLFINAVLSQPGQEVLYEATFADHLALPGSRTAVDVGDLRAKGVEFVKLDAQFYADHPEVQELTPAISGILRERASR
jgi:iron(III) transport system substrate-binding protein